MATMKDAEGMPSPFAEDDNNVLRHNSIHANIFPLAQNKSEPQTCWPDRNCNTHVVSAAPQERAPKACAKIALKNTAAHSVRRVRAPSRTRLRLRFF